MAPPAPGARSPCSADSSSSTGSSSRSSPASLRASTSQALALRLAGHPGVEPRAAEQEGLRVGLGVVPAQAVGQRQGDAAALLLAGREAGRHVGLAEARRRAAPAAARLQRGARSSACQGRAPAAACRRPRAESPPSGAGTQERRGQSRSQKRGAPDRDPGEARGAQCRKCRRPVNTIAMPCSSAAAMTSSSRLLPPGWTTAVTPAAASTSRPSRNGKKASEPATEPASRRARLRDREPAGVDAAHLAGADAHASGRRWRARWRST